MTVHLDPNHSHFVLVEGDRWGDETTKLFEIATALSTDDDDNDYNKTFTVGL